MIFNKDAIAQYLITTKNTPLLFKSEFNRNDVTLIEKFF